MLSTYLLIKITVTLIFVCCLFRLGLTAQYSCPVRIISNNAHSSASVEDDDPGNLLADDLESDSLLPEGGQNLQPLSNNTGFISSEQSIRKNYKWYYNDLYIDCLIILFIVNLFFWVVQTSMFKLFSISFNCFIGLHLRLTAIRQ